MAWISFVVVVLVFYTPVIGLGLPFVSLSLNVPLVGHVRLFVLSVGAWLVLWVALLVFERFSGVDLLSRARLRNGMVYASRPYVARRLAVVLAEMSLGYLIVRALLSLAARFVLSPIAPMLGALLPYDLDMGTVVLSILTLIAAYCFGVEQRYRYEADIKRNQRIRRREQTSIVIPATQE